MSYKMTVKTDKDQHVRIHAYSEDDQFVVEINGSRFSTDNKGMSAIQEIRYIVKCTQKHYAKYRSGVSRSEIHRLLMQHMKA
jgi:hypothetical protein